MAAHGDAFAAKRLDSWKEIAAFFGRGERTVKRWEVERGLPVHRLPGTGRSAVFAYTHELAEWLKGRRQDVDSSADSSNNKPWEKSVSEIAKAAKFGPSEAAGTPTVIPIQIPVTDSGNNLLNLHRLVWMAPLVLASSLLAIYSFRHAGWHLRPFARHRVNAEAQDLYLKGRYFWDRRTPDDLNRAIDYFTQAIVKDPGDAQAYVGLADCYNLLREFGAMPPADAYPRALAAAQRAVQLDGTSAEAYTSLAFPTFWWAWQAASAEREFKRALQLDPNFVRGHHWYATFLLAQHRNAEALEQIGEAQQLEPSSAAILADKGYILWCAGRRNEGLTLLKQVEASEPELSSLHSYLGKIYWEQQDYPGAIAEWRLDAELRRDHAGLAIADARAKGFSKGGLRGLLQSELPLQKELVDQGRGSAYDLAALYAQLGQKKQALSYLRTALDRHEAGLISEDPTIPALQNEPEYLKLKAQVASRQRQ
ncbi:MAG TPA: tetratricopeptide repeat protein [Candidatus Aquilonibacter sp.]|nr:tetratricopeptide repeat protein [Candidatus Aquilonibacter sp.]